MTGSSVLSVLSPGRSRAAAPLEPCRTAFRLDGKGREVFSWLHRAGDVSDHGVVICAPLGHEQVHGHRGMRRLADSLAAAGIPTLRFDYFGSGDSMGSAEEPHLVDAWLANVRDAVAWLRRTGCSRISLVGIRAGALLAARVAEEEAVDGLVLWGPVMRGRAFVREMKAVANLGGAPAQSTDQAIEAAGHVFSEETLRGLSSLDLARIRCRCRRILLVERDDAPPNGSLMDVWKQQDIVAERTVQTGFAEMLAEPHETTVPEAAIARIAAWLAAEGSDHDRVSLPEQPLYESAFAHGPCELRERAVIVCDRPRLFGIVCEPAKEPDAALPCIVMLNAGACHRVGPHRLYVELARAIAAEGYRSLRFDLHGLGDSVGEDVVENDPYPATAFRDVMLALDFVERELGATRCVLLGLCSGAYTVFQSAAQLATPLLAESVLINPLTFYWRQGMSLGAAPTEDISQFAACLRSVRQPGKWLRLLGGRSKLGIRGALDVLLRRGRLSLSSLAGTASAATQPRGEPGHPLHDDLPGDLQRVVRAGRALALFFSRTDPGYALLQLKAGRDVRALERAGHVCVEFVEDADHTFSSRLARSRLIGALVAHLKRRYSSTGASSAGGGD